MAGLFLDRYGTDTCRRVWQKLEKKDDVADAILIGIYALEKFCRRRIDYSPNISTIYQKKKTRLQKD
jgi:hypothetical protein